MTFSHDHDQSVTEEWRALVAAFGTMRAALGHHPAPSLLRFGCDVRLVRAVGCDVRLVRAVATAWHREHDAGESR